MHDRARRRGPHPRSLLIAAVFTTLGLGLLPTALPPDLTVSAAADGPRGAGGAPAVLPASPPVVAGARLTGVRAAQPDGPASAFVLTLDLTEDLRVDHLGAPAVAGTATLEELVALHDPGVDRVTVAAVNADFFDINQTYAPLGAGVRNGALLHSASPGRVEAVGFDTDGAGRMLEVLFEGKAVTAYGELPLSGYNAARLPVDGIGLYGPEWGPVNRSPVVERSPDVVEVEFRDGLVTAVNEGAGVGAVPDDGGLLLGRGAGARALEALLVGESVAPEFSARAADGGPLPRTVVGGQEPLVVDGIALSWDGAPNNVTAPRTAVGFSADGTEMYLVTVDGRQAHTVGMTLTALASFMAELGAHNALNLDGGGSTTLLVREPGAVAARVVNLPSGGSPRPIPNGLAITAPRGEGAPPGIRVETVSVGEDGEAVEELPGEASVNVERGTAPTGEAGTAREGAEPVPAVTGR
ncbi:phosphodiester glycosidase family protein [Streptomyces sp. ST2-7A]|uniref:phosphodiester glycosidase family protein n=1 Tax=Streptomyces sp. ST2-7A TaxID=2907214 RepID=UPI001F4415C1|nr:phosphodiester glycosidase family protein [Streptomyces sp. ST2-7A]MCE7081968.1 phosphodiester glycosidase family protein [Streptomyces sp. ST2-7A]